MHIKHIFGEGRSSLPIPGECYHCEARGADSEQGSPKTEEVHDENFGSSSESNLLGSNRECGSD